MRAFPAIVKAYFIVGALAVAPISIAQDGKTLVSLDGNCQVTVPSTWQTKPGFNIANAPDGKVDAAVSPSRTMTTLAQVKVRLQLMYTKDKIAKDTAEIFQMEGVGLDNRPNVYRALQIPGKVCVVDVNYSDGATDDARKIAESLKSAK